MLDISKLQRKESLAKEMVKLGTAPDLTTAYKQIEETELVSTYDEDFKIVEKEKPHKEVKIEVLKTEEKSVGEAMKTEANNPEGMISLVQRIDAIEKKINDLGAFLDKYKAQNDKNLIEVDSTLKALNLTVRDIKTNARIAASESAASQKPAPKKDADEYQAVSKPKDDWDTSQFAVDKIFNNSNNQMVNRNQPK